MKLLRSGIGRPRSPGARRGPRALARALIGTLIVSSTLAAVPLRATAVHTPAPGGGEFKLILSDLEFILAQIKIAEAHAAGGELFGPGPNQVSSPLLPFGPRTVDGRDTNIIGRLVTRHGALRGVTRHFGER